MDAEERERLLRQIDRRSATVGRRVPDTVVVGDTELDLSEFLIEIRKVDRIPEEQLELVNEARRTLSAERKHLRDRLETEDMPLEEAEELADQIIGLDRAIHALKTVRSASFGEATKSRKVADHKQWVKFLNQLAE